VNIVDHLHASFRDRAILGHVRADVEARLYDVEAFVARFLGHRAVSALQLRTHQSTLAKAAARNELAEDLRATNRATPPPMFAAQRDVTAVVFFGLLELLTLARVFLAMGLSPEEAYGTALIAAVTIVALIEGATRATRAIVRLLCYAALTISVLGIAWVRASAFVDGDGALDKAVGGVIAIMGAVGAGVALHYFRAKANTASVVQRRASALKRELTERTREQRAAEKNLIQHDIEAQMRAATESELRAMYPRLYRIEAARLGFDELPIRETS
jgi:hypothetical protein